MSKEKNCLFIFECVVPIQAIAFWKFCCLYSTPCRHTESYWRLTDFSATQWRFIDISKTPFWCHVHSGLREFLFCLVKYMSLKQRCETMPRCWCDVVSAPHKHLIITITFKFQLNLHKFLCKLLEHYFFHFFSFFFIYRMQIHLLTFSITQNNSKCILMSNENAKKY